MALIVFLVLLLVTQAAGYYRSRWSVADSEVSGGGDVAASATVGVGAGMAVLVLLLVLYLGITQWGWAGQPHPVSPATISTPAPIASPANPLPSATASP